MKANLQTFLEENDFNVIPGEDGIEIETWTDGGVNMIIYLSSFSLESLQEYIENFDVDEEIEIHRQDKRYCNAFTIRQSLNDFENFKKRLDGLSDKFLSYTTEKNRTLIEETLEKFIRFWDDVVKTEYTTKKTWVKKEGFVRDIEEALCLQEDDYHIEISSHYTKTGAPITFYF